MTTVSYMLREKESTPSSALGKRGLFIVTGIVGVLVIVSAGVLCRICLRLWRRQRRFKLLKKRYRQRVLDRANMRRGSYPSVGVEDANVLGNRLSSLRGRAPSHRRRFNPQAPPMLLPRRDVTQTFQSQDSGSQRNSITCVSNENAFYFPPSSAMQDLPSGLRGNAQNPEQRQLRPTSSTPAIGKVLGHLKKDKTGDRASASFSACSSPTGHRNHLTVPTITVGEDCGFSRTCSPVSIPSYLDLHTDDPALLFDLDPYHARHDHLRPPSHHSSYSSIRQGAPLLLRLDSSSSGATGNYFNLYEGLASRSSRSRSPSNVYDPLTFELSSRSNPPSRRGSRTHTETLHEATQPGMDENSDGNVHPLEGIFVPSDFRPDPDMPASSQADQTSLYRQSPSELHNSVTADSTHTGSLEGASAKTTLKHQHSNHLLASDYERIVKQSPTFLNRKKSNRKDDNLPFGPKRPRKSFELKNLFRQSFPRSTGENISQHTARDVTTAVNIPRSMQGTDRCLTLLPKHSDKTLNKNGIINNTKPPKAVSRVPPPPISNIKSLQEVEEPIYVDIDDNCKNGNTFPNLDENTTKLPDSNIKPEVLDNNNSITRNQHSNLTEIPPPDPRSKRSRDHTFNEAFVSLTSILAEGNPRGGKSRATEKMPSDSSAGRQSSLPDIMLCTDTVKAGEGSEEEAYSTIDFSVGLG
ncbi:hypothetical protein EGW08_018598 [Elysia chlorotica]|uniref:Uncharacterized protein n=1 Tax=Elysia chlorotica TaxID=188477 RepID=A0A3S0ZFC6_ELYCH|nr:hypothetical protein EGW08_018598 [Elysia chlorotica]